MLSHAVLGVKTCWPPVSCSDTTLPIAVEMPRQTMCHVFAGSHVLFVPRASLVAGGGAWQQWPNYGTGGYGTGWFVSVRQSFHTATGTWTAN